ncbi:MAG: hypothetical protein RJA66_967 [Actinomycetota bacterium]
MRVRLGRTFISGLLAIALGGFGFGPGMISSAQAAGSTPQVITPGPLPTNAQINQTLAMSATASSGLPVSISVDGSPVTVCYASSSSYFVTEAVGTCVITFEQAGDSTYAAAPTVTISISVEGAQQVISAGPALYIPVGSTGQITATNSSGLGLQYDVVYLGTPNCSVNSRGVVTGLTVGPCTVILKARGNLTYSAATPVYQSVWVTALPSPPGLPEAPPSVTPITPDPPANSGDVIFMLDEEATKKLKGSLNAKDVQSLTGGLVAFKGRNLLSVEKVFVGNSIPVKIVKSTDAAIELELPKASLVGLQTITLKTSVGERSYAEAVNYLAAPTILKPVTKILKGFKAGQASLTTSQKVALKAFVKSVGKFKVVECRGLTKPIYLACKYVKSIYKAGRVKVTKLNLKASNPAASQVRLVFSR